MAAKCRYHPDRDIEMYCESHDMVYCTKCVATEHRGCSSVKNIDELPKPQAPQTEIQRLYDEGTIVHRCLKVASEEKQKNIGSPEDQRCEMLEKIQDAEKRLKEHIIELKCEATNTLNHMFTEIKDELESEVNVITDTIKDIDESFSRLQTVASMDVGQQFVHLKLVQKSIAEAKKLHEDNESKGAKAIYFTVNTDLSKSVIKATALGQIVVTRKNLKQSRFRQYTMKARKDVNVKIKSDINTCYIGDMCQLQDGTILLIDFNNIKIKRLDLNNCIQDHFVLDAKPTGICCTGKNEVAVKMYNDKIQFMSVGASLSILREISIEGGSFFGIAYTPRELWVSTANGVNVYNVSGTLLKSIVRDGSGQYIFKGQTQHMAVSDDTVIVTDWNDGVVCLWNDGTVRRQLRDQRLKNTAGTCVSNDKIVFISGHSSHNIILYKLDGTCLEELVSEEQCLTCPGPLCK